MIIDFHTAPWVARRYDVLDAVTGDKLNGWAIFYADDEAGIIRCYSRDSAGVIELDETGKRPLRFELNKRIRIVPKSDEELAGIDRWDRMFGLDALSR
jgi:hypothetical protein